MRRSSLLLGVLLAACQTTDQVGPTTEASPGDGPEFAVAALPGIVFASFALTPAQFTTVHTGTVRGMSRGAILSYLQSVKAENGRVLLNLAGEPRNLDGTFSLTKWKALIDGYKGINFNSFILDGTLIGHFLIDEPHFQSRWGGKKVPQATLEAMAKYSKDRWPGLSTVVNAPPWWLAEAAAPTYVSLDAGWLMYSANVSSNVPLWVSNQVALAKKKGLGVFSGLNVLDGGNGSSGFRGNYPSKWAMSAAELRKYGSAILANSYVCGFAMWKYTSTYYGRADIKSAMGELSTKARNHAKTSCRQ